MRIQPDWEKIRDKKLFLATPMYGGQCGGPYMTSMIHLTAACMREEVKFQVQFLYNEALITRARDRLTYFFLESSATHLMFIDSDITFAAEDIFTLLQLDRDICGALYPKKQINWRNIERAVRAGKKTDDLPKFGMDYVCNWKDLGDIRIDTPHEVKHLGTGHMMIRRNVIETMRDKMPEIAYRPSDDDPLKDKGVKYHNFFSVGIDEHGYYVSEDWQFCDRARALGFKVYACPWMSLTHTGPYDFVGDMKVLEDTQ